MDTEFQMKIKEDFHSEFRIHHLPGVYDIKSMLYEYLLNI